MTKLPPNPLVFEILEAAGKARSKQEKIEILRKYESWALKDVLSSPPYEPNLPESTPSNLLRKNVDFQYIVKNGAGDTMPAFKREKLYIAILESIHPKDAEVVINMVNKKKPANGVTLKVVQEAFPSLIK